MKLYTIEPQTVSTNKFFECVRPFIITSEIGEKNIIELNLNKITDPEKEQEEMIAFCEKISKIVCKEIKITELSNIIKNREIIIEE